MRSIGSSSAERRPRATRRPLAQRATALVLSWVFTATTFWASAPPVAFAAPPPTGPLPALIPGFPDNLGHGQAPPQAQADPRGRDREGHPGAPSSAAAVRPICECVVEHGPDRFTAYFGYQNDNAAAVTIPAGVGNALSRPLPTRPPSVFQPGRTRGHEGAPFRVDFDGDAVTWTVKGPDGRVWTAMASRHSPRCGPPPPPPSCDRVFFGPQRYTRTTGEPDVFEETIEVPHSVGPPHVLRVQNGEPNGRKRVSSARVELNGKTVVRPSDLSPPVPGFHRAVTLTPRTELRVTLASAPGSFLQLSLCGSRRDLTPPTLAVVVPAPGSYSGVPADRVKLAYADAGSGIAPESVAATLDGTALSREGWTVTATAAEGPLAPPVGDGVHELVASVKDRAGNTATAKAPFIVDTLPPAVALDSPADGSYHKTSPVTLGGTVVDADPQVTVRCLREGAEAPAAIDGTAFTCALPLGEGANAVRAEGRDRLARVGTSEPRTLHLDTKPPEIVFTDPAPGSPVTGTTVDVRGEVRDASPIAWVKVAGREAQVSGTTFTANGVPIGDGPEISLTAEAEDAAGNQGQAVLSLTVDRQPPAVTIDRPVADAYVKGPVLEVEGTVADQGDVTVEVNGVPENPPASLRAPRGYRARVPVTDAASFALTATAIDAAGNRGSAQVDVHVDSAGPVVVIASPASGLVTKETSVLVTGTATDLSPIHSLTVGGQVVPVGPDGSFQVDVPLPAADTTVTLAAEAVDQAGNPGGASIEVVVDRTVPQITVNGPTKSAVLGESTVTVEGTVVEPHLEAVTVDGQPATVTGQAWQATVGGLAEGSHVFQVRAEDRAGNATALPWPVTIDVSAPGVVITSPAGGATRDATVTVAGTVRDRSLEALTVNGSSATWAGDPASPSGATFSASGVALADQQDNPITVEAKDVLQRTGSAVVHVFRDSLAPTIASFTTPARLVRGEPATAEASVDDGAGTGVATVAFFVNGQEKARLTSPPWKVDLEVPEGVAGGDTVTVAVQATDAVGNVSDPVSRGVVVAADSEGVVVGSVLGDETGRPLPGATVRMASGAGGPATATDEAGRYSLPAESATAVLVAEAEDRTSVERDLPVQAGVGTVPVDARLTPLAEGVPVGPGGGTLALGAAATPPSGTVGLAMTVPQDAFAGPVSLRLTRLTPQGLPNLLPLGFSPLAAFDLREDGGTAAALPLPATVTGLGDGTTPVHLVAYRTSVHAWVVVAPGLVPDAGAVSFALPGLGAYAVVSADTGEPAVTVPEAGQPLVGVAMAAIPATATSEGVVDPAVLPPTGGQAEGTLVLTSPLPLPSGTVVKAEVTESYTLSTDEKASEEKRSHDIVLFRGPTAHRLGLAPCTAKDAGATALCAAFPITPARAFEAGEWVEGKVHLDILAGREGVRGKVGGSEAVKVESAGGEASVFVPAQALPRNTAVAVETSELSSYLPSAGGVVALAELVVDFSGQTLALGAELSVRSPGVPAGTPLVLARVERVDGIPRLEVVSLARVETDGAGVERLVSEVFPGLAGVTKSGRYVFYRVGAPVGFVAGRTLQLGTGYAGVVVTTAGLPFAGVSTGTGAYVVAALPGEVTLTARKPRTSLAGEAGPVTVEAVPAAAASRDILLEGTATVATIVPANGTKDLPVTQQMEVRSPTALLAATVTLETIRLLRLEGATTTPVAVRLVQSGSGRTVAIIPQERLEYEATYRVEAQGLKDALNADVVVAPSVFTTRKEIPPAFHPERLVFELRPAQPGLVTVSGPGKGEAPPDGTFEAGTEILIINAGNGFVLTLTAGNENEVPATELPATIDDRLMITVTDPFGRTTSFERSQFKNPVTGETAVGPGGGVVEGPGGVEMRIPEGALAKGVAFTMEGLTAEALESAVGDEKVPDVPGAQVGSGIKIEAPTQPTFAKEVDLAFPVPAEAMAATGGKPEDAFFHVYRRVETASGSVFFENLDWAKVECPGGTSSCSDDEKKVVSSSFPWPGLMDVADKMTAALGMGPGGGAAASWIYLMWTHDSQIPGQPTQGTVTGRVVRPTWPEGATAAVYVGVPDVGVWGKDASGEDLVLSPNPLLPPETVAKTDKDGRFTFTDRRFTTGTLEVKARVGSEVYAAKAYAVSLTDTKALENPAIAALAKAGIFKQVATVEIVVPPLETPPPPPAVAINVMRLVDGKRVLTDGLVTRGTGLLFGFKSSRNLEVRGAEVEGQQLEVVPEDLSGTTAGSPLAMDKLGRDAGSVDGLYRPERTGRHRVKVAALPVTGGSALVEWFEATFLVVEGGEGNRTTREGEAPGVIAAKTLPRNGAGGVPVSLLPQVVFTEPVKNVPAGVVLEEIRRASGGIEVVDTIPLSLTGVRANETFADVVGPQDAVVSVMLLPQRGLKYKAEYRLRVTGEIEDLDATPRSLEPEYVSTFTTFGPEDLEAESERFSSAGLALLGDRLYMLETAYAGGVASGQQNGVLRTFDVSDPVEPREVGEKQSINFPPRDVAGDGERLAVVTSSRMYYTYSGEVRELVSTPGNLFLYDVSGDTPVWNGAASLTTSIVEGYANRVALKGGVAYVAVAKKGIQVVDLEAAETLFAASNPSLVFQQMSKPGGGFAPEAVKTIPVSDPAQPYAAALVDLKVADVAWLGEEKRLVFATGNSKALGMVVADTSLLRVVTQRADGQAGGMVVEKGTSSLDWGSAIAVGEVETRPLVLVGGIGKLNGAASAGLVAILDLTPMANRPPPGEPTPKPEVVAFVAVPGLPGDILIHGTTAIVSSSPGGTQEGAPGTATLIDLTDPANARVIGTLTGVGSRLALAGSSLLFSTGRTFLKTTPTELDGIRSAALGSLALVRSVKPFVVGVDERGRTTLPMTVKYQLINPPDDLRSGRINLYRDEELLGQFSVSDLKQGTFEVTLPADLAFDPPDDVVEFTVARLDGEETPPIRKRIGSGRDALGVVDGVVLPPPLFERLSPDRVKAGTAADLSVTVFGQNLAGVTQVFVRSGGGGWTVLPTISRQATSTTFRMTSDLITEPGFLQVAPSAEARGSLAFLVIDSSIPAPGTTHAMTLTSVEPTELGPGGQALTLSGSGFAEGVQVVLGRAGASGLVLPALADSASELEVELPADYLGHATDLFVAVLAADGSSLTSSLPVQSTVTYTLDMDAITAAGGVALLNASGTLIWNQEDQEIELEGVGLTAGMDAFFTTKKGKFATKTKPARHVAQSNPLTFVAVTPPPPVMRFPSFCLEFQGESSTVLNSPGMQCVVPQPRARIPLGGRLKFAVYREVDKDDGPIHILPVPDTTVGAFAQTCPPAHPFGSPIAVSPTNLLRKLNRLLPEKVSMSMDGNTSIPNPASATLARIPIVDEPEGNRCDPDHPYVFYLRGVRIPGVDEKLKVRANAINPDGTFTTDEIEVTVDDAGLGDGVSNGKIDPAILRAATKYGVPPQFLKAQAFYETKWDKREYRYEPITIDFNRFSSETRTPLQPRSQAILSQHLIANATQQSGVLKVTTQPSSSKTVTIQGQTGRGPFDLGGLVRGRSKTLREENDDILAAIQAGTAVREGANIVRINTPYRAPLVSARLLRSGQPAQDLALVEGPIWRKGGGEGDTATGLPSPTHELPMMADLQPGQFGVNCGAGKVTLGDALNASMTLEVTFSEVEYDPVSPGVCASGFDPGKLKTPDTKTTYRANDTIGEWLERTIQQRPSGNFLTGTRSERMIEYSLNDATGGPGEHVIDTRFHRTTAQYLAAGSFGPLQATLLDWFDRDQEGVLRAELDLAGAAPQQCLQDLADDEALAFRVGAARHTFGASRAKVPSCSTAPCDQVDWMKRWASIFEGYNRIDDHYRTTKRACIKKKKDGTCLQRRPDGFSDIIEDGMRKYYAR